MSKRKKVGSNVSIEQLNSAKSRSYSICFTIESVKKTGEPWTWKQRLAAISSNRSN